MTGYDNKRLDGRNKKKTVQYCCTYIRVHRCSSTSTYPRKRYATRRAVRRYIHTYIPYHFSIRCTTKSIAKKSPTGSLPPAAPLAITRTFRPWTHTSDDSYIYQLSLVVATATVSSLAASQSFCVGQILFFSWVALRR